MKDRTKTKINLIENARRYLTELDFGILIFVLLLTGFGVAMVFSAGYYQTMTLDKPDPAFYLIRQLFFVIAGWAIMIMVSHIDYHIYLKFAYILMILSVIVLVVVYFMGSSSHNAQRWITILGIRITPSEISKLCMIIFTSAVLVNKPNNARSLKMVLFLFAIMGVHFLLIVIQPNLSTAIVIVLIMFAIMIVGGVSLWTLVLPIVAAFAGTYYILAKKNPYHWYVRITSFLDPLSDLKGDGYQVSQGLIGLGNGGLTGLGFGNSITKNMYLPEPQNDFILAVIGEELGFIGFLFLMLLYILLLYRVFLIALKAKDRFGMYLAAGVGAMLGLQVVINVAVVTSSMPATGITLPFISYGGTSIIIFMASMGIVLNVERKARK